MSSCAQPGKPEKSKWEVLLVFGSILMGPVQQLWVLGNSLMGPGYFGTTGGGWVMFCQKVRHAHLSLGLDWAVQFETEEQTQD